MLCLLILLVFLSFSVSAQTLTSKKLATVTESGLYSIGRGYITSVLITTNGTNAGTCALYDSLGSTLSSEEIMPTITVPGAAMFGGGSFNIPLDYITGLTVVVTGTGASCTIYKLR